MFNNWTHLLAKNATQGNRRSCVSTNTFWTKRLGLQLCCNTNRTTDHEGQNKMFFTQHRTGLTSYVEVSPKVSLQLGIDDVAGFFAVVEQARVPGSVFSPSPRLTLLSMFGTLVARSRAPSRCSCLHHHAVAVLQGDASGGFHRHLLFGHSGARNCRREIKCK